MATRLRSQMEHLIEFSWAQVPTPELTELVAVAAQRWREFFERPEKLKDLGWRALAGYFPVHSERAIGAAESDPKEFVHISATFVAAMLNGPAIFDPSH